ncbi:MAG: DUF2207 domain-containing protein, partial [Clostridiales bacterium]|nr:DUF2207 domain-containing protein [Clostridiales bacterium]
SVIACAVFAFPPSVRTEAITIDTNYWFENVDVTIDINADKTMRITETMKVGFIKSDVNTGIIRDIQRISQTTRMINGEAQRGKEYFTQLTDVSVTIDGGPAKVTQSLYDMGQFHSIKMQKLDESYFEATVQGSVPIAERNYHIFVLSYTYDMSADKMGGYDDFTFDVLGYAMAFVRNFSATVTFPKAIDRENVSFRSNLKREWIPDAEEEESVEITDRTIKMVAAPCTENKGYTVQVLLPDGYFTEAPKPPMQKAYIPCFILAIAAIVAGGVLLLLYHIKKPVESVEFYPPKGMSVMRYSAVWYGKARQKDIPAMVLKWAADGYVQIEKDGKKDIFISKLNDLPEDTPPEEKKYFDALFYPIFTVEGGDSDVFSSKQMRLNRLATYKKARELHSAANSLPELASVPNPIEKGARRSRTVFEILSIVPFFALLLY